MKPTPPRGRPFEKGRSGNPGGRPKAYRKVVELARAETEESIRTLVKIRDDPEAPHAARGRAAEALLDRGWGKPTQPVDLDGGEDTRPVHEWSNKELQEYLDRHAGSSDDSEAEP